MAINSVLSVGPSAFNQVSMCASKRIHEVFRVVHASVHVTLVAEVAVSLPAVSNDRCAWQDELLDEGNQRRFVTFIPRTRSQEARVVSSLYPAKNPSPLHQSSTAVLSLAKLGLVYFNDGSDTTDLR